MEDRNYDPQLPVPPEDSSGRLQLVETTLNYARLTFGTFVVTCIVLLSLFYWNLYFTGSVPRFTRSAAQVVFDAWLRILGFGGIVFLPALPFLFVRLIFPPRLIVDDDGIVARKFWQMRRIRWEEIRSIKLTQINANRRGGTKTRTWVLGDDIKLSWLPVFDVEPHALADYLNARRSRRDH